MQKAKKISGIRKSNDSKKDHSFEKQFIEVSEIILSGRRKAYSSINTSLIETYWHVGRYIHQKISTAEWGEATVEQLVEFLAKTLPDFRGFNRRSLYRMKQFYEAYCIDEFVSALLTQITWTNHLLILSKVKPIEERRFYLENAHTQQWSSRELERQINGGLYERSLLQPKISSVLKNQYPAAENVFRDSYSLDFLGLPPVHFEADLRKGIVSSLKQFIIEFGRDFAFVGEEYRLQVGMKDFFIDLLFYHRELQCLVAFELKVDEFKPEYMGKLSFYLEALDRDLKKAHEKPSIGIILCKGKDSEIVEYALARTTSPAVIAEYTTKLPDKRLLQSKLHEFFDASVREMQAEYRSVADTD